MTKIQPKKSEYLLRNSVTKFMQIKNNPIFRHYNNRNDYTIFSICCQVKKDRVKICKI